MSDIVTVIYILFSVIAPSLNPRHCFLLLWLLQCRVYQCLHSKHCCTVITFSSTAKQTAVVSVCSRWVAERLKMEGDQFIKHDDI